MENHKTKMLKNGENAISKDLEIEKSRIRKIEELRKRNGPKSKNRKI